MASVGDNLRSGGAKGLPRSLVQLIANIDAEIAAAGAGVKSYALLRMGTTQDSTAVAGNHVEFDTITEQSANADISVSTGAGQLDGLITLPAGKIFKVECQVAAILVSTVASFRLQIRDNTAGALIGDFVLVEPFSVASEVHSPVMCMAFAPASSLEIEARIVSVTGTIVQIQNSNIRGTMLRVTEL